jgi:hypothetical protein
MSATYWESHQTVGALLFNHPGEIPRRKRQLFACACARRVWDLIQPEVYRNLITLAEAEADGAAVADAMRPGIDHALDVIRAERSLPAKIALAATRADAARVSLAVRQLKVPPGALRKRRGRVGEDFCQAILLRDILGNPFRPIRIDPAWLRWNGGLVTTMAQQIYAERRFDDLPILADALEEAGCDNADILAHCRSRRGHALGCWVLDLLLGKE